MFTNPLLPRCIDASTCPEPLPCACTGTQLCVQINRDCNNCARTACVDQDTPTTSSGGGVNKGAVAGGVIGAIFIFVVTLLFFIRRRKAALVRKHRSSSREVKKDIPASAETVLNRPDPTEKPPSELNTIRVYSTSSNTTIDLDPRSQASTSHPPHGFLPPTNPFDDTNSIQTAGTGGTNVIPIALVPADSHRLSATNSDHSTPSTNASYPTRPARSPDLNLNLDHVNVSHDNIRANNGYSQSTRSGVSGFSSRNSYMSSASYSSDFLNEAPMIMTSSKGNVRLVKAEVINAGSFNSANGSSDSLRPPAYTRPTTIKSPLASTSFGPSDLLKEADEGQEVANPFSDTISNHASYAPSPSMTANFGRMSTQPAAGDGDWVPDTPHLPWARSGDDSRPSSMSTQAGSVIDIASARRVNVGLKTPASANSYRTTMGRLVTPPTGAGGTLQEQQQRALAHAQAQAQAQLGLDRRRISGSSVLSAASTRADSILESFPFVTPSPISDRPIRSPPVSPLAQQSFTKPNSPLHQHTFTVAPPSPASNQSFTPEATKTSFLSQSEQADDYLPAPPNRRTLGLSTGSQLSTASSGLGSFPFQIESDPTTDSRPPPMPLNAPRQRASLDTLALTSDLSSYPLGFDRDSVQPGKKEER